MGIHSQAWCWHHAHCSTFSITCQEAGCCTGIPAAALWAAQLSKSIRDCQSTAQMLLQQRASDSVAQALTGQFDAAQPKKERPFAELKTFQSIEQLYKIATHGDALSNTPSFAEMQNLTQIGGNTCANGSMSSMAFSCASGSPQAEGFLPTSICLNLGIFEIVLFSRQKEV